MGEIGNVKRKDLIERKRGLKDEAIKQSV